MDMKNALVAHLKQQLADSNLDPEAAAKMVDEIHQIQRRVIKPRDTSMDQQPITVGIAR